MLLSLLAPWSKVPDPVFVVGTGRSGTHWLAEALGASPELKVTLEVPPRFAWSTTIALDPSRGADLLPRLLRNYRWARRRWAPRRLVDKAHPNLWHAESLREAFPAASFLGIRREAHATVASMIRHPSVRAWHERWREFPLPNRFLGIRPWIVDRYETLTLAERCTLRWLAHRDRMRELGPILGERLLVVEYRSMMEDTRSTLDRIASFLGLRRPIALPEVHVESRDRWRSELDAADIDRIDALAAEWDRIEGGGRCRTPERDD